MAGAGNFRGVGNDGSVVHCRSIIDGRSVGNVVHVRYRRRSGVNRSGVINGIGIPRRKAGKRAKGKRKRRTRKRGTKKRRTTVPVKTVRIKTPSLRRQAAGR